MKLRKELWFGFSLMAIISAGTLYMLLTANPLERGHLGLMMLALIVVAIMLGFPTAFTLMGMGMVFTWLAYGGNTELTLTLMVQKAYSVMANDVLISVPLFVFMGYLVERANLIDKLFRSLHLALSRVPGSLAVATLVTCAVFATATGIVGAVVTLMGLLAFPQMLKAGYDVRISAGAITAGGCLGILIPPSVLLIVYGATAGVSVVQLYAGAFFPGLMLAGLYVIYVVVLAKIKPSFAPPLSEESRRVPLPAPLQRLSETVSRRALPGLLAGLRGASGVSRGYAARQLGIALLPALFVATIAWMAYGGETAAVAQTAPRTVGGVGLPPGAAAESDVAGSLREPPGAQRGGLQEPPGAASGGLQEPPGAASSGGLQEPPGAGASGGVQEPPGAASGGLQEPPGSSAGGLSEPPGSGGVREPPGAQGAAKPGAVSQAPAQAGGESASYWIGIGICALLLAGFYALLSFQRLEVFKMLLTSFFPLLVLILAVLGSIVFGLATPTEAAAVGAFGGYVLACMYALVAKPGARLRSTLLLWGLLWLPALVAITWFLLHNNGVVANPVVPQLGMAAVIGVGIWALIGYRQAGLKSELRESVFLTAKTTAMVCWLFVGSAIFSSAFALLGGQELVERWVLSMNLSKIEFLVLSQVIIFILGWPLEWTEIIVIFMPIFVPLLDNFGVDPLFFGLLVALNLQTAFLSPPVAMSAFYLKGVSPPHVTLNQIFAGMLPFMGIQIVAIVLLYVFPQIGLWLPQVLYSR
jgi:TRAP-type mannitol/chloroaromatic compound transport system permease large subunit